MTKNLLDPQYPRKQGEHDSGVMSLHQWPAGGTQQFSSSRRPHASPPPLTSLRPTHQPFQTPQGDFICLCVTLGTGPTAGPRSPTSRRPRPDLSVNIQGPRGVTEPSLGSCPPTALTKDHLANTPEMPGTLEGDAPFHPSFAEKPSWPSVSPGQLALTLSLNLGQGWC